MMYQVGKSFATGWRKAPLKGQSTPPVPFSQGRKYHQVTQGVPQLGSYIESGLEPRPSGVWQHLNQLSDFAIGVTCFDKYI